MWSIGNFCDGAKIIISLRKYIYFTILRYMCHYRIKKPNWILLYLQPLKNWITKSIVDKSKVSLTFLEGSFGPKKLGSFLYAPPYVVYYFLYFVIFLPAPYLWEFIFWNTIDNSGIFFSRKRSPSPITEKSRT